MKNALFISAIILCITASVSSQCFPDRHSTNFFDGWISCEIAPNPNPVRPASHFIMYDFGKVFKLGQMEIWNTNDPAHLDWGMRDVAIDYSIDGENWLTAGDFTFPQASGLSTYEGSEGPHLNGVEARYLLITGLNNYGGECFGLSEMKVEGEEVVISDVDDIVSLDCVDVTLYPNPFSEKMTISLSPDCTGEFHYKLYDAVGHELISEKLDLSSGINTSVEIGNDLLPGTYMLVLEIGNKSIQKNIIKMGRT